jgi:predicted HicB family RNase H-like nuclease
MEAEMQNVVKLPQELYEAVHKKAAAQQKSADDLVIEWLSEHLDESETSDL